ncbi:SDR family oxidoreductase [Nitratidesulfovibrio liaohensis]|uniref:SDR family oxidoreductase n=1 Tax=Nitratidesulfovibrio liaohensis TaxID=2604158 RepID=A0ABY9R1Y5_9BACT|nr:SDR family oxidoreductase [Nitratidesulfovibrio liaohensis]WMW64784.1 SDR family oxidoreductase [Nitratidesulfovibrio liaohensis]
MEHHAPSSNAHVPAPAHPFAHPLSGRVALVTGGAQGIGRGIVEHLLACGMRVAAMDADAEALAELVAGLAPELAADNGAPCPARPETPASPHPLAPSLLALNGSVADQADADHCVAATVARFGGLHLLVNNAGIANPHSGPADVAVMDMDRWQRMLDVNLTGPMRMVRAAVPHLRAARGAVVNIASTRAVQSEPHTEAYAASKGGLVALTHALAVSLGPEVRVNCISPGWIEVRHLRKAAHRETPMHTDADRAQHPVGRVGTVRDVAALVAFLAGDDAGFVTGQNWLVDGGMTRRMIYEE